MGILCMGETLLRFATGKGHRFRDLDFDVHIGGSETNMAVNLAQYGFETSLLTKLPRHALGDAVISFLHSYHVDTSQIMRNDRRIGTYYLENGSGVRASQVIYDRGDSAMTTFTLDDVDLDALFANVDVFLVTGITVALTKQLEEAVLAMLTYARAHGIMTVYDQNYRARLWTIEEAGAALRRLLPYVDVLSAGILDAKAFLGLESQAESFEAQLDDCYHQIKKQYPMLRYMTCTHREILSTSVNQLTGYLFSDQLYVSQTLTIDDIVDRVGGGDAFLSGILYGLLTGKDESYTVNFAAAASALKHTVYGDVNQFTAAETEAFMASGVSRINR